MFRASWRGRVGDLADTPFTIPPPLPPFTIPPPLPPFTTPPPLPPSSLPPTAPHFVLHSVGVISSYSHCGLPASVLGLSGFRTWWERYCACSFWASSMVEYASGRFESNSVLCLYLPLSAPFTDPALKLDGSINFCSS